MKKYLKAKYKELKEEDYQIMNYPTMSKSTWWGIYGIFSTISIILISIHISIPFMIAVIPISLYFIFMIVYYTYILPLKFYESKYGSCGLGDAYKKLETK